MEARTIFLSKLIGLYCIVIAVAMSVDKPATVNAVVALVGSPPLVLLVGLVVVAAGLALVLSHNVWRGSALAVVVTLIGWLTLVKGALFLFSPAPAAGGFVVWGAAYERWFYVDVALAFALGIYLTYAGFRATPASPT
jgi:putative exporter of polyketide antibiotics